MGSRSSTSIARLIIKKACDEYIRNGPILHGAHSDLPLGMVLMELRTTTKTKNGRTMEKATVTGSLRYRVSSKPATKAYTPQPCSASCTNIIRTPRCMLKNSTNYSRTNCAVARFPREQTILQRFPNSWRRRRRYNAQNRCAYREMADDQSSHLPVQHPVPLSICPRSRCR